MPTSAVPPEGERPPLSTVVVIGAGLALLLAAQIPIAISLLHPNVAYEAGHAKTVLAVNTLLAAATVALAAFLPQRLRTVALAPGALVAATMLGGAVTAGGHLWDFTVAALTLGAGWWLGRSTLRVLRATQLRGVFIVELVIGIAGSGLVVLALGRLDVIAWWSIGVLTIAVGTVGLWQGARQGWERRGAVMAAVTSSPVAAACAGLLLLQLGWAVVWLSAPEIMFDPLYSKAYLPELWAQTGSIGPLLTHPQLNVMGLSQVFAAAGHTVGAPDVGRELQMLAWVALTATIWWWAGPRSFVGPLAALAVGIAPHVVWQSTTAFDDLLLSSGAVALAIAVFRTVGDRTAADGTRFGTAVAVGLLAGAAIWLKLHLTFLALAAVIGWLALSGPRRGLVARTLGVLVGGALVAAPAFVLRWIDTGNPVFPSYNDVFKSPHYPFVNEQFNFPYWPQAHMWEIVKVPYEAVVHPWLMVEATPKGGFGLLVAAFVLALLIGWRQPNRRAGMIVWTALVVTVVVWWAEFRYLRYLLPSALVAVLLLVTQLRGLRPGRGATLVALLATGAASALYLPSTVATFWNVPHRNLPFAAAFGRWDKHDYLRTVYPETDALAAYQRLAPPGSIALSDAFERLFLHDRDLSPFWEVSRLLQVSGPPPATADAALLRLRMMGIHWALVTGPNRTASGFAWLPALLAQHGDAVFSDRGWDLYRLVDRPTRPHGLVRVKNGTGTVRVCPGETVAVRVSVPSADPGPAQISLNADGEIGLSGHTSETVSPGGDWWIYGTAPAGARTTTVSIAGGPNVHARVGLLGRCTSNRR